VPLCAPDRWLRVRHSVRVPDQLLPDAIAAQALRFPEFRMGVHRVAVTLRNGEQFDGVLVGWGHEVVRVEGFEALPFDPEDVISVRDASDW